VVVEVKPVEIRISPERAREMRLISEALRYGIFHCAVQAFYFALVEVFVRDTRPKGDILVATEIAE
jgi:hypothetical protein